MTQKPLKRLLLKLGTKCNLSCPHCHQVQKHVKEHPRLIDWIKEQRFDQITFSGGEPLMYFDIIKRIMVAVGKDTVYRMMSNGTLLSDEIVEFFNEYHVKYAISYDGVNGGRDLTVPIRWDKAKNLKRCGTCAIFSTPTFSFREYAKDIEKVCKSTGFSSWTDPEFLNIGWIHQTPDAPNKEFTKETADSFIEQVTNQIDKSLYCWSQNQLSGFTLKSNIRRWYEKRKTVHGTFCCNEALISVNLDGTIMQCPYGTRVIGSIYNMPSMELLDSFVPEKCKHCEFWDICHCSCVASITELDCYVNKTMIPRVKELIAKYGVEKEVRDIFGQ